jgi:phage host-nuclease inhibitor protein Gam
MMQLRENDPKAKVSTPYGKISVRKQPAKWNYEDEKVLEWLKLNGKLALVRIKEEVNKAELKKVFKNGVDLETGEVIPGIIIEDGYDKITVEVE